MTGDRSLFKVFESKKGGNVTFSDGSKSQIKGKGIISLLGLLDIANNGVVERKNRVIQEMARAILHNKDVAKNLWGEVVNTACHTDRENVGKFDSRSDEGIFLGYSSTSKDYQVYNKRTIKVMETVNVVIDESSNSSSEKGIEELPEEILPLKSREVQDIAEQEPASPSTSGTPSIEEDSVDIPTSPDSESHEEKGPPSRIRLNHPPEVIVGNMNELILRKR
nr:uncharacterized protein LOC111983046 [Quercus suber]